VSEGKIEGLIFWRRLRNDIVEREGARIISESTPRQGRCASGWAGLEIGNRTSKGTLV